jgi:ABC-type branched-subunit amino acid transport system substrate-binding protein
MKFFNHREKNIRRLRWSGRTVALWCLGWCAILASASCSAQPTPKTTIGISTSLTGPASNYGIDIRNAILFANKVLANNAYEIVVEDDRCDGKTSVSIAKKLVEMDHARAILGYTCSSSIMAVAPYLERKKVVAIAAGTTAPQIGDAGDYIFRTIQGDDRGTQILFDHALKRYQRLGVLSAQTEWNEGIRARLLGLARDTPLVVKMEEVIPTPYDYKSSLLKLVRGGADAIFLNVMPEAAFLAALKQVQELQFKGDVLAFYHPGSESFRNKVQGPLPPIYYIDNGAPNEMFTPAGREVLGQFEREYGPLNSVPLTFASAFESFRALHEALQSGGVLTDYLLTHSFDGVIGRWSFDSRGEIVGLDVKLVTFQPS